MLSRMSLTQKQLEMQVRNLSKAKMNGGQHTVNHQATPFESGIDMDQDVDGTGKTARYKQS